MHEYRKLFHIFVTAVTVTAITAHLTAVAAEVKRQKKNFKPELLTTKVEHLKNKLLPDYQVEMVCLSLEDM